LAPASDHNRDGRARPRRISASAGEPSSSSMLTATRPARSSPPEASRRDLDRALAARAGGRIDAGPIRAHAALADGALPRRCESGRGDEYETRGAATLAQLGDRFVLTVHCDGVHRIYARGAPGVPLDGFVGKPVRVRYHYVEEVNPRTRCVRAHVPPRPNACWRSAPSKWSRDTDAPHVHLTVRPPARV